MACSPRSGTTAGPPTRTSGSGCSASIATLAPELVSSSPLLGTVDGERELAGHAAAIAATNAFSVADIRRYRWQHRYRPGEWLDLARTQSDHRLVGDERLEALLAAVAHELERHDEDVPVRYESVALVAQRR